MLYGACEGDTIQGVIATRNQGNHIVLFFVDGTYRCHTQNKHNRHREKIFFLTFNYNDVRYLLDIVE